MNFFAAPHHTHSHTHGLTYNTCICIKLSLRDYRHKIYYHLSPSLPVCGCLCVCVPVCVSVCIKIHLLSIFRNTLGIWHDYTHSNLLSKLNLRLADQFNNMNHMERFALERCAFARKFTISGYLRPAYCYFLWLKFFSIQFLLYFFFLFLFVFFILFVFQFVEIFVLHFRSRVACDLLVAYIEFCIYIYIIYFFDFVCYSLCIDSVYHQLSV